MRLLPLLALLAMPAFAAETVRLPDAERDRIIAQAAAGPERDPVLTAQQGFDKGNVADSSVLTRSLYPEFTGEAPGKPDRKPHGEMSMFVGSGGARGIAGTVGMPLGDNGYGSFGFSQGRLPGWPGDRPGGWYGGGFGGYSAFSGRLSFGDGLLGQRPGW